MGGSSSSVLGNPTAPFSDTAARFASWAAFRAFRGHLALPGASSVVTTGGQSLGLRERRERGSAPLVGLAALPSWGFSTG